MFNPSLSRFFWEGFLPFDIDFDDATLTIRLKPDPRRSPVCSGCLQPQQRLSLQELLQANQPLSVAYILGEQLKEIWRSPSVWEAFKRWRE